MTMNTILQAILDFDEALLKKSVQEQLDAGTDINIILDKGLIQAMDVVGQKFTKGEIFVPEMMIAAETMQVGLELLKPLLVSDSNESKGTIVIGTVKGDLHDIGKNLVSLMLDGGGFDVIDLGVDIEPEKFIQAAEENKADIIGLSALLTTAMPIMEKTVNLIKKSNLPAKTFIGGAPVTLQFSEQIGADGYSENAPGAVAVARKLIANALPVN
ncbi:MAG: corrinoid protein [Deltaproteobacteria bacterium]|jgi:methylmalonyl-CoA mutase cobalamin-binding domain/chain|nr:corrinoid protein [Deltaproteobacteria bacterium]